MNMRFNNHRYISFLFLILLSQSVFTEFTDPRNSKADFSHDDASPFDAKFAHTKKSHDQDNKKDTEQDEQRKALLLCLIKEFHEEKNIPSKDDFHVDADVSYVMALKVVIAKITKRTLDATTIIPLALLNAYKNRKLPRDQRELLEYDFDLIDQIMNGRHKPTLPADKILKNNTVYAVAMPAAAAAAGAAIHAVTGVTAFVVIGNREEDQVVKEVSKQFGTQATKETPQESFKESVKETIKPAAQESTKEASKKIAKETPKKSIKKDIVFSSSENATQYAVKTFQAQRAHDTEKRDKIVEGLAAGFVGVCQQYQAQQNSVRRAKKDAEWAKEAEADIQKRMRDGCKSRFQIEEEDRLRAEKWERDRIEEARHKQEEATRQREEKKKKNLKQPNKQKQNDTNRNNNSGPDKNPKNNNKKDKIVKAAATKEAKDEAERAINKYTNGKGVHESNPKHNQNAPKGIGKEPARPVEALKDSHYVSEKTRVAVQDRKIVVFRKHGETADGFPIYHSYIENDIHRVPGAKQVLEKAGLIHPKTGKVLKK